MKPLKPAEVEIMVKRESEIWLYSYADLITNLLAFFILMLALSKADHDVVNKVKHSIQQAVRPVEEPANDLTKDLAKALKGVNLTSNVALTKVHDGVTLTFSGGLFFEMGSTELMPEAKAMLDKVAPVLQQLPADHVIEVEGHSDSLRIQSTDQYPSNWELSAARAATVVRYLIDKGMRKQLFKAVGYADTLPVSQNPEQNRRVVLSIVRVRK